MKNAFFVIGDMYNQGTNPPLSTSESFYKPVLELIQEFYNEQGYFDVSNPNESDLYIGGIYQYETKDWGSKPTIIVSRGSIVANTRRSFRQKQHVIPKDGTTIYADQAMGSCNIKVIAANDTEVERIANEVFDLIWLLKTDVFAKFGMYEIQEMEMGQIQKLSGGAIEHLMICPISIKMVLNRRWAVTPEAPLMQQGENCNVQRTQS